jgi:putative heme iron utilization protein
MERYTGEEIYQLFKAIPLGEFGYDEIKDMCIADEAEAEIAELKEMLAQVMTYTIIPNSVTNEIRTLLSKHKEG